MKLDTLTNNMIRPKILDDLILLNKNSILKYQIEPLFNNLCLRINITFYFSDKIASYNPSLLINYFNSFDYIKVISWDDDKEFDFSYINHVYFIFELSKEFLSDFFMLYNFNIKNVIEIINFKIINFFDNKDFQDIFLRYFLDKFIHDTNIKEG